MKRTILLSLFSATFLFACNSGNSNNQSEDADVVVENEATEKGEISLVPAEDAPQFEDAILEQIAPENGQKLKAGPVTFNYNVKNYKLTKMTESQHAEMLANSNKGQHIHLILNNQPYDAVYETTYKKDLEAGHYVELSFLSRSFHMSLKHPEAYVLRQFTVGNASAEKVDLNAPHMFYSRPKGTYTGPQEANNVMLDFYLVNTDLSENGKKVRATINGKEFMITKWEPYVIKGLPMGEATIKLELLDENNNLVQSPFNPVTRTITLEEGEQPTM